jgi:hypothetical protein
MKKSIHFVNASGIISIFVACFCLNACKKDREAQPPQALNLLTSVTETNPGFVDNGKTIGQFTYNGKQLEKAVLVVSGRGYETHTFNYNNNGQVASTNIRVAVTVNGSPDSVITNYVCNFTYTGNEVTEIKEYKAGSGTMLVDMVRTFQNGQLSSQLLTENLAYPSSIVFAPNSAADTTFYSYDKNGNVTTVSDHYSDGLDYTSRYQSFDTGHDICSALPYWYYLMAFSSTEFTMAFSGNGGPNNVLTGEDEGSETFSYQYDINKYPISLKYVLSGYNTTGAQSFAFQYMQAN